MINFFKNRHGMNLVGQGGAIIAFMLPSLLAALYVHVSLPQAAALPDSLDFIQPFGYLFLVLGVMLWGSAIVQLLTKFPKGVLVTTGAYGIVRNPIYSSVTFFVLPGIALLTMTWVYLVVAAFLYTGVVLFIGKEEAQLSSTFGGEYEEYKQRVHRLIPLMRP